MKRTINTEVISQTIGAAKDNLRDARDKAQENLRDAKDNLREARDKAHENWRAVVKKYENPQLWGSLWQVANSLIPYFIVWYLMYLSLSVSYWLTLLLSVFAAGFLVRVFIILHDCGHGSFFKSQRANHFLGVITGIMVFTPFFKWRHEHAIHHATSADLDRRGVGDIWTMTVGEFKAASWWKRLFYTVYRNPVVMFVIAPLLLFVIGERIPNNKLPRREQFNVWFTNTALAAIVAVASMTIGLRDYVLIQLPTMGIAAAAGVWMFYVQHQFEEGYWVRHPEWDYFTASIKGSSYYKLPAILQWFTGNIGVHHIHHLSPKIPNYRLQQCHDENKIFQDVKAITFWTSLKALAYRLWDEKREQYVWFDAVGGD